MKSFLPGSPGDFTIVVVNGVKIEATVLHDAQSVSQALTQMGKEISESLRNFTKHPKLLLGIQQGGVAVSKILRERIFSLTKEEFHTGALDCSFYRDDIAIRLQTPRQTILPIGLDGAAVVFVDDVFDSGRTLRAALDALHEYGRPAVIRCAVLVERDAALLPLRADAVGFRIPATEFPGRIHASGFGIFWEKSDE